MAKKPVVKRPVTKVAAITESKSSLGFLKGKTHKQFLADRIAQLTEEENLRNKTIKNLNNKSTLNFDKQYNLAVEKYNELRHSQIAKKHKDVFATIRLNLETIKETRNQIYLDILLLQLEQIGSSL